MANCVSTHEDEMYVTKRDGKSEIVSFDKILQRIKRIGKETNINVNYTALAMKVIDQLFDSISTTKIDELSAEQCASMASIHYDYNTLAGRIIVSNHQKNTCESFSEVMEQLYGYLDKHGKPSPLVSEELISVVRENHDILDDLCDYSRDYLIDYFGFKTLDRAYMMKIDGKTVERPQHMWLRVSIGIHGHDIDKVIETYEFMSQKYFTHATPTLFNSGTPRPQLSSCFLLAMENDSIDGIYNTLKDCALISKLAGGIGLHIHNIRATGSHIRGTNGTSNGIVPMLRVFNNTAKYVDQCVTPETIIYTDEGPIKIESCISGKTKVFNKTGGIETIENVLEHYYQGPMLIIRTTFSRTPLQITPLHPVYTLKMGKGPNPEWIDAQDLQIGDRIVYSLPTWEQDVENITEDDCKLYALLFIYGGMNEGKYFINIDTCKDDTIAKELYDFITTYLQTMLVEYKADEHMKMIEWLPALHLPFRNGDLYDANGKKRIHSRWLLLPKNKTIILYNNLWKNSSNMNDTDIKDILQWLAIKVTPNSLYTLIKSIYKTEYSGILYDLQMKTQHDYLIENGLIHNGGGKRNGSFAIYLEPWHADIEMFLQMRKNHGDEELKARDLFYAIWIPDLFMERVKANGKWTLMCPDECPGLADVYGEEFKTLYESYEQAGRGRITIQARDLWYKVMDAQMETGTPYLLYKDACNRKSNQKNVGTIKSSNLCSEVVQYSDDKETAVCNLASIGLPTFIKNGVFDYEMLHKITKIVTKNLNKIIDVNYYPTEKTRRSNMRHRPIGIGVQGLADVFIILGHPFLSDEAKQINRNIFETMYHAALESSQELAIVEGPYETFEGSPASKGELQFDLWSVDPGSSRYDWAKLKQDIMKNGIRNSLLLAPMPTASTSQILGFNECIEPITSNIYSRRTLAGEFIQANKYLMADLMNLNLWNDKIKNNIIANHGSIQQIVEIPQEIKDKYKTVWEMPMRGLIDMAADRGAFICQSQSLNLWIEDPNYNTLTASAFYSWSKGLKTGIYYLRRRGKHQAQQFTIEPEKASNSQVQEEDDICEMCSA
jgi:ribonucleoside-diphosphate reductase alpha subunit